MVINFLENNLVSNIHNFRAVDSTEIIDVSYSDLGNILIPGNTRKRSGFGKQRDCDPPVRQLAKKG